jgi:hypothetical protein
VWVVKDLPNPSPAQVYADLPEVCISNMLSVILRFGTLRISRPLLSYPSRICSSPSSGRYSEMTSGSCSDIFP